MYNSCVNKITYDQIENVKIYNKDIKTW